MSGITFNGDPSQAGGIMGELMKKLGKQRQDENIAAARQMNVPEKFAKGGKVSSASSRADGCAQRGKTKGKVL